MQGLYEENYKTRFLIHIHKQKHIPDGTRLTYLKKTFKTLSKKGEYFYAFILHREMVFIILYSKDK